ncbi:MAG: glutathione S-transferase family protein [Rhizomicrobium sp.]
MMRLYWSDVLSPRKACAVAKYLGAPVEYVYLDLPRAEHRTPAMLALNPSGKVPTLADGDRVVCEADAILCHLSDRTGADLWPADRAAQVDIVTWFSWAAHHFGRAGGALYFEHIIKPRFAIGPADPAVVAEAQAEFRRFAAVLDDHLRDRKWLLGERLSVADFSVAVTLPYAEEAQMPLNEFPAVCRWHDRLSELEAWRDPWPAR